LELAFGTSGSDGNLGQTSRTTGSGIESTRTLARTSVDSNAVSLAGGNITKLTARSGVFIGARACTVGIGGAVAGAISRVRELTI
jgi:hypothetical protein